MSRDAALTLNEHGDVIVIHAEKPTARSSDARVEYRTRAEIKRLCLEALRRVPGCEHTHSTRIGRCDADGANWTLLMAHPMPPLSSIPELEAVIDGLRARYWLIEPDPS